MRPLDFLIPRIVAQAYCSSRLGAILDFEAEENPVRFLRERCSGSVGTGIYAVLKYKSSKSAPLCGVASQQVSALFGADKIHAHQNIFKRPVIKRI